MLAVVAGTFILSVTAGAHAIGANAGGFLSGLVHPVFGPDHLLAMFAVGLWGAQIGGRSVWELPVAFPLIMTFGGTLGIIGIPLPYTEILIAASMVVLGLAVAFAWRPASWLSIAVVGMFAIFHGHAHGVELPSSANPFAYALGFVAATGLIHIAGIGFGLILGRAMDGKVSRAAGAVIGLAGAWYLLA
jgi:urease accessory protein